MIPEIHVQKLLPYALAMGYSSMDNDRGYDRKMAEFYALVNDVKGERGLRGYPTEVVTDNPVIR